jgi:hypothetical protein
MIEVVICSALDSPTQRRVLDPNEMVQPAPALTEEATL